MPFDSLSLSLSLSLQAASKERRPSLFLALEGPDPIFIYPEREGKRDATTSINFSQPSQALGRTQWQPNKDTNE